MQNPWRPTSSEAGSVSGVLSTEAQPACQESQELQEILAAPRLIATGPVSTEEQGDVGCGSAPTTTYVVAAISVGSPSRAYLARQYPNVG
jgi:hypothetical protein